MRVKIYYYVYKKMVNCIKISLQIIKKIYDAIIWTYGLSKFYRFFSPCIFGKNASILISVYNFY